MTASISNTTLAVLNCVAKTYSGVSFPAGQSQNFMAIAGDIKDGQYTFTTGSASNASDVPLNVTTQTITTTQAPYNGYVTIPNDNTYYPTIPYIGDPVPANPGWGTPYPINPQPFTIPPVVIKPDLESLEEGVHDIPGGKIIIKKVKIDQEQLDKALEEVVGHEPTDEEKAQLKKELEDIAASEEREI